MGMHKRAEASEGMGREVGESWLEVGGGLYLGPRQLQLPIHPSSKASGCQFPLNQKALPVPLQPLSS